MLDAERKLWLSSNIFSPYDGKLVATKKAPGQIVQMGEPVSLLGMVPQYRKKLLIVSPEAKRGEIVFGRGSRRVSVAYTLDPHRFHDAVQAAISVLVPDVQASVHVKGNRIMIAAINGPLANLEELSLIESNLFDIQNVPVFAVLFTIGDEWVNQDLSIIALVNPLDAKRVKVGHRALVKPGFEKSLVGTQVMAQVKHVGDYVTTSIEAQALVGSQEIAQFLSGENGGVAIQLEFQKDLYGNYLLDGERLSRPLSVGTMAEVKVHVETTSPIEVLLPFYVDIFKKG